MHKIKRKLCVRYYEEKKIFYLRYYVIYARLYSYVTTPKKKVVFIRQYQENKFSVVLCILLLKTTSDFLDAQF